MEGKTILILAIMITALTSCDHKHFEFDIDFTPTLLVEFDWSLAPDAKPGGMTAIFFPVDGVGQSKTFNFDSPDGGYVYLEPGRYNVIGRNNGNDEVDQFSGIDKFDTYELFTRECNIFEPVFGNGADYSAIKDLGFDCHLGMWPCYTATMLDVEITGESQVITMKPEQRTATYEVEATGIKNLVDVKQSSGALTGMCQGLFLGDCTLDHTETITVPFATYNLNDSTVTGSYYSLPYCREHQPECKLYLFFWLKDRRRYYYTIDVTDQVRASTDPYLYKIRIDGIDLPPAQKDDEGGFDVNIAGWDDVNQDIAM